MDDDGSDSEREHVDSMYAAKASPMEETMASRLLEHEESGRSPRSMASGPPMAPTTNGLDGVNGANGVRAYGVSNVSTSSLFTDDDFYDNDDCSKSSDGDEGPTTLAGRAVHWFTMPLQILFKCTCPPAGEGVPLRHAHPCTVTLTHTG